MVEIHRECNNQIAVIKFDRQTKLSPTSERKNVSDSQTHVFSVKYYTVLENQTQFLKFLNLKFHKMC